MEEYRTKFWAKIEEQLQTPISPFLRNILKFEGLDNVAAMKGFRPGNQEEIAALLESVKSPEYAAQADGGDPLDFFNALDQQDARFRMGDIIQLKAIQKLIAESDKAIWKGLINKPRPKRVVTTRTSASNNSGMVVSPDSDIKKIKQLAFKQGGEENLPELSVIIKDDRNSRTAVITCSCKKKTTLQKDGNKWTLTNFYKHLKTAYHGTWLTANLGPQLPPVDHGENADAVDRRNENTNNQNEPIMDNIPQDPEESMDNEGAANGSSVPTDDEDDLLQDLDGSNLSTLQSSFSRQSTEPLDKRRRVLTFSEL